MIRPAARCLIRAAGCADGVSAPGTSGAGKRQAIAGTDGHAECS